MNKDEYEEICNFFAEVLQKMLTSMAMTLGRSDIHLMAVGHLLFIHPGIKNFKAATLGMGPKNIILKMPDQLKKDLMENFEKIEKEEFKEDIIAGFKVLENKKNIIH